MFEGVFHGRPVAVKRLLKQFYDLAANEKDILILSDENPNLIRLFAMEEDKQFVYLALERCQTSLASLMASAGEPMLMCAISFQHTNKGILWYRIYNMVWNAKPCLEHIVCAKN